MRRVRTELSGLLVISVAGFCVVSGCPTVTDMDSDGIPDTSDNCLNVANADQLDTDDDGVGDACDNCPNAANAAQTDTDTDDVADACDNCPDTANADQADTDADGLGDVCDNCPNAANADQADGDSDGLGAACDNCPAIANADQSDVDGDGIGDVCEVVDLAVADYPLRVAADSRVQLYFDVLAGDGSQDPDVTLDNTGSGISYPVSIKLAADDLYVTNAGTQTVGIFRDYRSLADNAAPSATLTNAPPPAGAGLISPILLLVNDDRLYLSDWADDEVLIFNDADSIAADRPADITLDAGGSLLDAPFWITVADDSLYAVNYGNETVTVYRDLAGLVDGAAPDVTLTAAGSFLGYQTRVATVRVLDNVLYVGCTEQIPGDDAYMFVFQNADALTDDQTPDAVLTRTSSQLDYPRDMLLIGDTLYVANSQGWADVPPGDIGPPPMPGVLGFSAAGGLVDGQWPSVILEWTHSGLIGAFELRYAGNALIVVSSYTDGVFPTTGQVHVFRHADALQSFQVPDFALNDPEDLLSPTAMDVVER